MSVNLATAVYQRSEHGTPVVYGWVCMLVKGTSYHQAISLLKLYMFW
jgi:hypothetical protein